MSESPQLNKWQKITLWFMGIVAAVVVVYDVFVAFFNDAKSDTVSSMIRWASHDHWSLPFAIGAVFIGHFFLYGRPVVAQPWAFAIMAAVFGILLTLDLLGLSPQIHPVIFLALGAIAGHLFWPMAPLK